MIVIGDLHGDFAFLRNLIKKIPLNSHLIQVGDFGIGFHSYQHDEWELNKLNRALQERKSYLYAIRGNHDNPNYFLGDYLYSNLELLPDYSIKIIEKKTVLFVGGALSINRIDLVENVDWWRDELFVYREMNLPVIDVLVTHAAPSGLEPLLPSEILLNYLKRKSVTMREVQKERQEIKKLYDQVKEDLQYYFYGHYHKHFYQKDGSVTCVGLGVKEVREYGTY